MNIWPKASFFLVITLASLGFGQFAKAEECPLLPQTPYKAPNSPDIYYINRSCTKQIFTNETAYFAYFSSWKQVLTTSADTIWSIPSDERGPMRYRSSTVTQLPTESTNIVAEFLRCPSETERALIDRDFNLIWDNEWTSYPFNCDYRNNNPSRVPMYATLRFIKNIKFEKPLPFTGGASLYTYLTDNKLTINTIQDCSHTMSGGKRNLYMGGSWAHMNPIGSGSPKECNFSSLNGIEIIDGFVYNPIHKVGPFLWAAAVAMHSYDVKYTNEQDEDINYSVWAKPFYFYAWTYLYANNVSVEDKKIAKQSAIYTIQDRFKANRCPTEPELKAVVNKIIPNTCK